MIELIKFPIRLAAQTVFVVVALPFILGYWALLILGDVLDWAFEGHV